MDDARTKATLDALADLFLTGPAIAPPPLPAMGGATPAAQPARVTASIDDLTGPRPIRMPPRLRSFPPAAPPEPPPSSHSDHGSEQPAVPPRPPLRLRRPEPIAPPEASEAPAPPVEIHEYSQSEPALASAGAIELHTEAVFLGNLPGFGGPWLIQYAHRVAQRHGPVVVLHVDQHQIDIDLVTSNRAPLPQDVGFADAEAEAALDRWIDETGVRSLPELLKGLLLEAPVAAATWLIHLSANVDQDVRALASKFDRWTMLCGADELAVNSAQRLLKQLTGDGVAAAQIGLMVFGADEARSLQVADRLTALSQDLLHHPIGLAGWQKQMVPVNLRTLGSYLGTAQVWPAVWALIEAHGGVSAATEDDHDSLARVAAAPPGESPTPAEKPDSSFSSATAPEPPESPEPPASHGAPATHTVSDDDLVEEELSAFEAAQMAKARAKAAFESPRTVQQPASREEGVLYAKPKRPIASAPKNPTAPPPAAKPAPSPVHAAVAESPAPRPAAQPEPVSETEPDLSTFLPAGTVALQARCPRHPRTQLVLDDQGVIHILGRHAAGDPHEPVTGLGEAVISLIEARAWVREHFKLLTLTQRQLRFDRRAKPVLHLFTDQAKLAAALTGRLGRFVRIHLLQRVAVGDRSAWVGTELN